GFKDDAKCRPARITDALAELSIPYHVGDPQIFEVDRVEVAYEGVGGLVMEVGALALHLLLLARPQLDRLLAALAALLAPGDAALGFLEPFLRFAVMARVVDRVTLSGDDKHLQPHVNARLTTSRWQRLCRHLSTGEAHLPPVRLTRERDGLGRPL